MIRHQASLYLPDQLHIEALRFRHNPVQARLIPAHVTLCRDDEVRNWVAFQTRLQSLRPFEITLTFGKPVREHNFVYLPVQKGIDDYRDLRRTILLEEVREQTPHLTLIHPRNGTCNDQIFDDISATIVSPFQFTFREIMLIQQEDGGVWTVISKIGKSRERETFGQGGKPSDAPKSPISSEFEP